MESKLYEVNDNSIDVVLEPSFQYGCTTTVVIDPNKLFTEYIKKN